MNDLLSLSDCICIGRIQSEGSLFVVSWMLILDWTHCFITINTYRYTALAPLILSGKIMSPKIDVFKLPLILLTVIGINRELTGLRRRFMPALNIFGIVWSMTTLSIMLVSVVRPGVNLQHRLEAAMVVSCVLPAIYGVIVLSIYKEPLFRCIDRANKIIANVERKVGPATTSLQWQKKTRAFITAYALTHTTAVSITVTVTFYAYFVKGDEKAAPYDIYAPFSRNAGPIANCAYQVSLLVPPVVGTVIVKGINVAFAIVMSQVIRQTRELFEKLSRSGYKPILKQAIGWHSEISLLVRETNDLFGIIFAVEYGATTLSLCFSSYLMAINRSQGSAVVFKYLDVAIVLTITPLIDCIAGQSISHENDKLCEAIYNNSWYEIPAKDRRHLIPSIMIANKGLVWHSKMIIVYNLAAFLAMVRQAYGFFTLITAVNE